MAIAFASLMRWLPDLVLLATIPLVKQCPPRQRSRKKVLGTDLPSLVALRPSLREGPQDVTAEYPDWDTEDQIPQKLCPVGVNGLRA